MFGVTKSYPGVRALRGIDLTIKGEEIHGLVGENGAGKSTLLKMLAGAHGPTSGEMEVFGRKAEFSSPRDANRHGIATVYQELTALPALTAIANVFLGREPRRGPIQNRVLMRRRYNELCERLEVEIPPGTRAGSLSIADRQVLEIMRALEADARLILFDEPTASLAVHEREALHKTMRRLRDQRVTQVLVSHDLDEVLDLADTITVFRDGQCVATKTAPGWTKRSVVTAMFGDRSITEVPRTREPGKEVLRATGVHVPGFVRSGDISVRAGEILGIAGLVGSGRSELLRALAGADPGSRGELEIKGEKVKWPRSTRRALRLGIGLAPEDRKSQGLVLGMTTCVNINLTNLGDSANGGIISRGEQLSRADALADRVHLRHDAVRRPVRTLSGGNQQKAVLAKWANRDLDVLLVDEPTRGIDVATKAEVFTLLDELAAQGLAVIIVSSELEELTDNCDRVVVLARGQTTLELESEDLEVETILNTIFEVEGRAA
jgi:ABC-type sugar transport system ATPase subunit